VPIQAEAETQPENKKKDTLMCLASGHRNLTAITGSSESCAADRRRTDRSQNDTYNFKNAAGLCGNQCADALKTGSAVP
jgi:hypothetical protein